MLGSIAIKASPYPQFILPLIGTLILHSPVSQFKKLTKDQRELPTLGALSYSLLDDLVAGNDKALFKKIDRLQNAQYCLFSEFFYFLTSDWDVLSHRYKEKYKLSLPEINLMRDQNHCWDCKKFESLFFDLTFLTDYVLKRIGDIFERQFYSLYGLGLRLVLDGRLDVLIYLLNDKLHRFDAIFLKFIKQQGLHCLALLDYMAQFAILTQVAKRPILVALPSIEYQLLKNDELIFANDFGSVIHFLWMNPINLRDAQRHNRLFFIDQNIPDYRQLIETTIDSIQRVIKHQVLDNFFGLAAELEELDVKLSTLPHFFAKSKAVLAESDNPDHLSSTVQNTVLNTTG